MVLQEDVHVEPLEEFLVVLLEKNSGGTSRVILSETPIGILVRTSVEIICGTPRTISGIKLFYKNRYRNFRQYIQRCVIPGEPVYRTFRKNLGGLLNEVAG